MRPRFAPSPFRSWPDHLLPPGKYYVQAVFYRAFITFTVAEQPKTLNEVDAFYRAFDRRELFRSNVVEIELLPAPVAGGG